ncbi:hypothetical protein HaLaN_09080, partial [Haematococcus lacustris]
MYIAQPQRSLRACAAKGGLPLDSKLALQTMHIPGIPAGSLQDVLCHAHGIYIGSATRLDLTRRRNDYYPLHDLVLYDVVT